MRGTRARASIASIAIVGLAMTFATGPAASDPAGTDHLPNLRTRKPARLTVTHESGRKLLRFTNVIANLGSGPLEVRPENGASGTTAYQRVLTHDTSGAWTLSYERTVGTFVFHPEHNHWHFEEFASYRLHALSSTGGIGTLVSSHQDKVSFCLADSNVANRRLEHFSSRSVYPTTCSQQAMQGISVGWADRYAWRLAGQWVDITDVPDGTYWLVSTADPIDRLVEESEGDNTFALKVRISGNSATAV